MALFKRLSSAGLLHNGKCNEGLLLYLDPNSLIADTTTKQQKSSIALVIHGKIQCLLHVWVKRNRSGTWEVHFHVSLWTFIH